MTSLIQKLRDATSGSIDLDHEVLTALGFNARIEHNMHGGRYVSAYNYGKPGHFEGDTEVTTSLDAIIGLIEEKGQHVRYISWHRFPAAESAVNACVGKTRAESKSAVHVDAVLALNIALLSAVEGES